MAGRNSTEVPRRPRPNRIQATVPVASFGPLSQPAAHANTHTHREAIMHSCTHTHTHSCKLHRQLTLWRDGVQPDCSREEGAAIKAVKRDGDDRDDEDEKEEDPPHGDDEEELVEKPRGIRQAHIGPLEGGPGVGRCAEQDLQEAPDEHPRASNEVGEGGGEEGGPNDRKEAATLAARPHTRDDKDGKHDHGDEDRDAIPVSLVNHVILPRVALFHADGTGGCWGVELIHR